MQVFPFLHPSYGQCGGRVDDLPWQERTWREVTLSPGELLYIPPFWLHEVVGITPSVAFNVWTGVTDEDIFQKVSARLSLCLIRNSLLCMQTDSEQADSGVGSVVQCRS